MMKLSNTVTTYPFFTHDSVFALLNYTASKLQEGEHYFNVQLFLSFLFEAHFCYFSALGEATISELRSGEEDTASRSQTTYGLCKRRPADIRSELIYRRHSFCSSLLPGEKGFLLLAPCH